MIHTPLNFLEPIKQYDTPLFVYDTRIISETYKHLRQYLLKEIDLFYSMKANPNISIVKFLHKLGSSVEVCSRTELETALLAGVEPNKIIFVGPGKTIEDLRRSIATKIKYIVVESEQELILINTISDELGLKTPILIRINPSFKSKKSRLTMGGKARQFGIDEEEFFNILDHLEYYDNIKLCGIHVYLGTRILHSSEIIENTNQILALAQKIQDRIKHPLETVDIGGGFGIPYHDDEEDLNINSTISGINELVKIYNEKNKETKIILELGRYLIGKCGIFISKVLYTKKSYGEHFIITDGGTNCHLAASGLGSLTKKNFPIKNLSNINEEKKEHYNITGPLCTPNDLIAKNIALNEVSVGHYIGIFNSGAYGPSASPTYFLGHGHPAEVLVLNGKHHLIRKRDSYKDLLSNQINMNFDEEI